MSCVRKTTEILAKVPSGTKINVCCAMIFSTVSVKCCLGCASALYPISDALYFVLADMTL